MKLSDIEFEVETKLPPGNEGGYYNFCTLKEYRKQKINRINAKNK